MTLSLCYQIDGADRPAIKSITESSGFFTDSEVAIALGVFDEALASATSTYRYILAKSDGMTVGYACYGKDDQTESSYELYWIAVDNVCRDAGTGKLLLHSVESAICAQGKAQLFIETAGRAQYLPTRRFYEHQGYRQVAWLDDYFAPGDARVIFAKRL